MYYVYHLYSHETVYVTSFLDDVEVWFNNNDPHRQYHDVDFESRD